MYEYNFEKKRNNIEEILKNSIEKNREQYYFQFEIFKNNQKSQYNNSKNGNNIKKKKTIVKNEDNNQKEVVDFDEIDKLKFETFYNVGFGLFDMTSSIIYKNFRNIKFEYIIFKNCVFKNVQFENCVFLGCEFLECEFINTEFKSNTFYDLKTKNLTYFFNSSFENVTFKASDLKRVIFQMNNIKNINFILSNLKKSIFEKNKIESIYFTDCDLKSFSMINNEIEKLEFEDEFLTKLNENTFFDKIIVPNPVKKDYTNIYKIYKNIASQFESNRILSISGEYHYLYKCNENKVLKGFSKIKSKIFWIICGYGERPTYTLITSFEIILIFAIIYLFTGISVGGKSINYNLSLIFMLEKNMILVDFLEALYFSLVTFTTVGYGDIIPVGVSIILSSIEMILGVTMVGIWTATLARKITR